MSGSKLTDVQSKFIESLYIENKVSIYKFVNSMTRWNSRIDREAIVQETFVTAMKKVDQLMKHPAPIHWLYMTARNKAIDELKRKINLIEIPTTLEHLDEYESAESKEDNSLLNFECILTSDEIALLQKRWGEGYTVSELAVKNSAKPGTMRMRMSRIYAKIKKVKLRTL